MSKKRYKSTQYSENKDFLEPLFCSKYEHLIFVGLIFVLLSIFFFQMAYLGYGPKASDSLQWRGAAQVLIEYNENNKDQALWNSNLFSGMPAFLISYPSRYPFLKNIFDFISKYLINWTVLYMFLAGLGMYILMLSLGFKPFVAFICGISFALSCHFIGLIEIGHNTKYRAVVYIPWIFWGLNYLFHKRNLLGMGLTAMFLIQQLRENHIQITYYTFIFIGIYWIFSFFWFKKDFRLKEFAIASLLFVAVLFIVGLAVSHPYLSVREYGNYTIRGEGGLTTDYATSWSFHPLEILTFIMPDFFGGVSPHYWGWMPFTQTSMYMGVIIFILALIAIFSWRDRMVKMLTVVSIVTLFISFGKHFPLLSNFLLSYMPFFNKFRVPAMILVLIQFGVVVMAGYGMKEIYHRYKEGDEKYTKIIFKLFIGCLALLLLFVIITETGGWNRLSFEHHSDGGRYEPRQLDYLKSLRIKAFENSGLLSFAMLSAFFLLTYLLLKRKGITPYLYLILIAAISITDIMLINRRHFPNLVTKSELQEEFVKTEADNFLLEDNDLFRIFPLREEFGQSRWAYNHQTIGGYHGAKLRRYQDILDYCLYAELKYRVPINWNIVRMLNVKYLVTPVQLPFDNLEWSFYDRQKRVTIYKKTDSLPRAWFVNEIETITEAKDIFRRLNNAEFDPAHTAIVETHLTNINAPDSSKVNVINHSLNKITLRAETNTRSLLVLSEIYYPAGWNAYINGEKIDILPVNYILRGLVIPAGEHTIEMVFSPSSHRVSLFLSLIGIIVTIVLVIVGSYYYYKENFCGGIDYIMKS